MVCNRVLARTYAPYTFLGNAEHRRCCLSSRSVNEDNSVLRILAAFLGKSHQTKAIAIDQVNAVSQSGLLCRHHAIPMRSQQWGLCCPSLKNDANNEID